MNNLEPLLSHELTVIQKIIRDETWLEGERRGRYVPPSDRAVRENVCQIILRIGAQIRASATEATAQGLNCESVTYSEHVHHRAA